MMLPPLPPPPPASASAFGAAAQARGGKQPLLLRLRGGGQDGGGGGRGAPPSPAALLVEDQFALSRFWSDWRAAEHRFLSGAAPAPAPGSSCYYGGILSFCGFIDRLFLGGGELHAHSHPII